MLIQFAMCNRTIMLAGMLFMPCQLSLALDEVQVTRSLQTPIIGSETTLHEAQAYTEQRVPAMPKPESADDWLKISKTIRKQVLDQVIYRGQAERWRQEPTRVRWLDEIEGDGTYLIRTLVYEAVPGMWVPALLYQPAQLTGKVPVVLNVNGHDRPNGKAADYKQIRCINQAKRGIIALNVEWLGMGQLQSAGMQHYAMNQLDLCGTSGLAPFYLSMKRGLDILLEHPHADPARVGVAGLSGGGWQTIVISSLDERVTLANPVAGYSSFVTRARHFKDLGDSEQTPTDLARYADYTHLTAMLAPRTALLTYNLTDDCCFEATYALQPLLDAAGPIYRLLGQSHRLRSHVNVDPGTHNFEQDNRQALYAAIGDSFFFDDNNFTPTEIDCAELLKTKDELTVPIPPDNATFNSLAVALSRDLPESTVSTDDRAAALRWQRSGKERLREIIRLDRANYDFHAEQQNSYTRDGVRITHWRLKVGGNWTVPVTEFAPPQTTKTVILMSDEGRMTCGTEVTRWLKENRRVLAVDPFYFGEASISQKPFLFAFMVATVGHRPLGVQAGQVAAVARWSRRQRPDHPVILDAYGPRTSLIAMVAAAIGNQHVDSIRLHQSMGSLKECIEGNQLANQTPELFCFGLLKEFDVLQLAALVAPREVTIADPSDRARQELASLKQFYGLLGSDFDPLGQPSDTQSD